MSIQTYINKVDISFNYSKFLDAYNIYKITNKSSSTKEYKRFYSDIKKSIKPLAHVRDGRYTIIISDEKNLLNRCNKDFEIIQLQLAELKREKKDRLLKLFTSLLAAKSNYFEVDGDPYGLYYIVKREKSKIVTINIDIDYNSNIQLKVATFEKKEPYKNEIRYRLSGDKLVRASSDDKDDLYSKSNRYSKKSSYDFIGLVMNSKEKALSNSKVYILIKYLNSMDRYFSDIVKIAPQSLEFNLLNNGKDKDTRVDIIKDSIREIVLKNKAINIANLTQEDLKDEIAILKKEIREYIGSKISITSSKSIKSDRLNFTITYDEEYYKKYKLKDPYKKIKQKNQFTQNMTIDVFKTITQNKSLLHVLLKELVVKDEIKNNILQLPSNRLKNATVIYPQKNQDTCQCYKCFIDGARIDFNDITDKDIYLCEKISSMLEYWEYLEAIIMIDNDISYIVKSSQYPLPNIYKVDELLKEYEKPTYLHKNKIIEVWDNIYKESEKQLLKNRLLDDIKGNINENSEVNLKSIKLGRDNKEFKEKLEEIVGKDLVLSLRGGDNREFIESLIGIRYNLSQNKYYIGVNNNLRTSIAKASVIREVRVYRGNNIFEEILSSLDEYFVKNGDFTVLPYPIKYIKEYYKIGKRVFDINKLVSEIASNFIATEEISSTVGKEI